MTGAMGCAAPGGVGLFSPAHRERSFLQRAGPEVRAAGFSEPVESDLVVPAALISDVSCRAIHRKGKH